MLSSHNSTNPTSQTQVSLPVKLTLSFIIVIFLSFSIWFKVDYFRDAFSYGSLETDVIDSQTSEHTGEIEIYPELIQTIEDISRTFESLTARTQTSQFYYAVNLGEFNSTLALDSALERWQTAGFLNLEKVESLPYTLTFGKYVLESEASLIAELIENGTKKPVKIIIIEY